MGACLSSAGDSIHQSNSALVISIKGELRQYQTPIFVSEVLQYENQPSLFVCNSDNLYYDQNIPALDSEDDLDAGQIYFILPNTMLGNRLSASDMAALAVKASVALDSDSNSSSDSDSQKRKKNKARISPLVLMEMSQINEIVEEEHQNKRYKQQQQIGSLQVSRSGSIRKIPRYSSKKGRLQAAVRSSFRLRLSTIYENEACEDISPATN